MVTRSLIEILKDGVEIIIDNSLDDGLIKDIPFVGWIVKTYDIASSIKDKLFASKIIKFIDAIEEISEEDKNKITDKMINSPKEASKIGEILILTIEKITDADKSEIIANVFIAYTQNVIIASELRRMVDIIDRVFIDDLLEMINAHNLSRGDIDYCFTQLKNTSLVDTKGSDKIGDMGELFYSLSKFGHKFIIAYNCGEKLRKI